MSIQAVSRPPGWRGDAGGRAAPMRITGNGWPPGGGVEGSEENTLRPGIAAMASRRFISRSATAAGLILALAVSVYWLGRAYPPELVGALPTLPLPRPAPSALLGSAPSLLFTLGIGLLLGAVSANAAAARRHLLCWTALAAGLELAQHPLLAGPFAALLQDGLPHGAWRFMQAYWMRGVFDPLDLFACLAGGLLAAVLCRVFSTEAVS